MKVLQPIQSSLVVGLDIETVRIAEKFTDLTPEFQSAWSYKNKQDGVIPNQEELCELWERTSSLYAEFSKVCAVSLSFLDQKGVLVCKEFYGENEKALLEALAITLTNMYNKSRDYRLAGHASKYFDYPFMAKRFIVNGLDIPAVLDVTNSKPWEQSNLCTNELWKVGGTGAGSSLQALCTVLGIPISKVDLVGDEVGTAFYKREFERIGRYCSYDAIATFNIIRRFKKESIFQFEDVQYFVIYSDELAEPTEEEIKLPLLEKIYKAVAIDDITKKTIEDIFKKKKPTKREKTILEDILTSLYVNSEMFKSDKPEIKKAKEEEIKQLING